MTTLAQVTTFDNTQNFAKPKKFTNEEKKNLEAKKQKDTYNQFCKLANL
jgi:hypothetical protein